MELIAHNHCWNAIKVDGLWRLVDCADGARLRGHTRCFFTAPEHFRMVYQPLNAPWSLLRDYISDQAFFSQMWASVRFFKSGCRVLDPLQGRAVIELPAPMEGLPLPVQCMMLAVAPGYTYAVHACCDTFRVAQWECIVLLSYANTFRELGSYSTGIRSVCSEYNVEKQADGLVCAIVGSPRHCIGIELQLCQVVLLVLLWLGLHLVTLVSW